jgi:hypothetical protein
VRVERKRAVFECENPGNTFLGAVHAFFDMVLHQDPVAVVKRNAE